MKDVSKEKYRVRHNWGHAVYDTLAEAEAAVTKLIECPYNTSESATYAIDLVKTETLTIFDWKGNVK